MTRQLIIAFRDDSIPKNYCHANVKLLDKLNGGSLTAINKCFVAVEKIASILPILKKILNLI